MNNIPTPKESSKGNSKTDMPTEAADSDSANNENGQALAGTKLDFPWKLHRMLNNVERTGQGDIVSWLPDGRAFKVHNKDKFVSQIMPLYFHSTKYKSFQRSLNQWGFESIRQGPTDIKGATFNLHFVRDSPKLCGLIVRKVPARPPRTAGSNQKQRSSVASSASHESERPDPQANAAPAFSENSETRLMARPETSPEETAGGRLIPSTVTVPKQHSMLRAPTPLTGGEDRAQHYPNLLTALQLQQQQQQQQHYPSLLAALQQQQQQQQQPQQQQSAQMAQSRAIAGFEQQVALTAWLSQQQHQQQHQLQHQQQQEQQQQQQQSALSDLIALIQQQEQEASWKACLERAALESACLSLYNRPMMVGAGLGLGHPVSSVANSGHSAPSIVPSSSGSTAAPHLPSLWTLGGKSASDVLAAFSIRR
jgi:HSF-type DNA-binding